MRFVLLTALTVLAAALRLWGIGFGLPWHFHPDEPAHVLEPVAIAHAEPHALSFANPPLDKDLLLGVYTVTQNLGAEPTQLFLTARATSAITGALAVPATYFLGASLRGPRVGLAAAALTSVAFLLVRESHFAVNDALVTLLATLALGVCVRLTRGGRPRDYALAGAVIGLTVAAKYQAAAIALPFGIAWSASRRIPNLALAGAAALGATLVVFPSVVLEPTRVLSDFYVFDLLPARLGYDGLDAGGAYVYYFSALGMGLGWPAVVLAAIGTGYAVARRERRLLLVASLPIVLYMVMGASKMYFARFLLPSLPALTVLAAVAVSDVVRRRLLAVAAFVFAIGWTAKDSVQFDALLAQPDTRVQAAAWIQSELPAEARIAADSLPLGVPLLRAERAPAALYDTTLAEYRQWGIEYLVTSSFVTDARPIDPARDTRRRTFIAELSTAAEVVAEFRPSSTEHEFVYDRIYAPYDALSDFTQPGPTVRVYRMKRN